MKKRSTRQKSARSKKAKQTRQKKAQSCQITQPSGTVDVEDGYIQAYGRCPVPDGYSLIRVHAITYAQGDPEPTDMWLGWESEDVGDPNPGDWRVDVFDDCGDSTGDRTIKVWCVFEPDVGGGDEYVSEVKQDFTCNCVGPDERIWKYLMKRKSLGVPLEPVWDGRWMYYRHLPVNDSYYGALLMLDGRPLRASRLAFAAHDVHWRSPTTRGQLATITHPEGNGKNANRNWRFRSVKQYSIAVFQPPNVWMISATNRIRPAVIDLSPRLPVFVQVNGLKDGITESSGSFSLWVQERRTKRRGKHRGC